MKKVNKNGSKMQFNKGAKAPANFSKPKSQPRVSGIVNKGAKAPVQFMKAVKAGAGSTSDSSTGQFTEKGNGAAVRRAAKANKTSYGSKNVGADIGGGQE